MSILKIDEIQPQSGSDIDVKGNVVIGEGGDPKALDVTGNIDAAGDLAIGTDVLIVDSATGKVKAKGLLITDDEGSGEAGKVMLTNVNDAALSTGVGTILLKGTGTTSDSAGWLKMYIGTTVVYVPYFTDITG